MARQKPVISRQVHEQGARLANALWRTQQIDARPVDFAGDEVVDHLAERAGGSGLGRGRVCELLFDWCPHPTAGAELTLPVLFGPEFHHLAEWTRESRHQSASRILDVGQTVGIGALHHHGREVGSHHRRRVLVAGRVEELRPQIAM